MRKFIILILTLTSFSSFTQDEKRKIAVDSLNGKANDFYYKQKDSAYFYFQKIYDIAKKNKDTKNLIQTLFNLTGVASYHHDMKTMASNLQELDSIFASTNQQEKNLSSNEEINFFLYYQGRYHYQLSEDSDSKKAFKKIISNVSGSPDSLTLQSLTSAAYSFLGKIYLTERKFDLAKQLYSKNIRKISANEDVDLEALHGNFNLLAEVLMNEKKFNEANIYWIKTLKYNQQNKNSNALIANSFYIAQNFNELGKKDSALYYLEYAKSVLNDNPIFYPKYHMLKSEIFAKNKDYELALSELQQAIKEIQGKLGNNRHLDLASAYIEIGKINDLVGEQQIALKSYSLAEEQFEKSGNRSIHELKLFKNKAYTLNRTKGLKNYLMSIETIDNGALLLNNLKPTFRSQEDKLLLIEDAFPLFESGLEAAYQIYRSTKDENNINQAFSYAEKSKSVLLLESLLGSKATKFANIPDDLLERERQLKLEITYVEKQLNSAKTETAILKDQLFTLNEEYRDLIKKIETDYKTYYDLKYNSKTLSLPETQKLLKPDEKLISYFYGNEAIYTIGIDKKSKQIERISIDASLEEEIKTMHQMLGDPKSDVSILAATSNKLFKRLVAPFITSEENKKLIIVADGLLNYIPFGALNTEENGLSYLMENYAVSYTNSATLNAQLLDRETKNSDLLAFAPSFKGEQVEHDPSRANLLPLPHNKREVQQILSSFNGQSFVNEKASLQNFTTQLSNFGILHLATHAVFDDTAPEYSYLAFSNTKNDENLLYVSDLYNLKIDADMVTLSACETGVGELKRGEGFMSLARGFFYSGASSIASTLWKVNDASSTSLMNSFYKNLSEGMAKDLALQKAQSSFLETNRENGLSHPYYWSGFVISGNTTPLKTPDYYWLWICIAILLAVVAGFLVFRREKANPILLKSLMLFPFYNYNHL